MKRTRVRWARVLGLLVGGVLSASVMTARAATKPPERTAARLYVVRSGDTLWRIARSQATSGADIRPLVDRLMLVNHLRATTIRPGQQLLLPS